MPTWLAILIAGMFAIPLVYFVAVLTARYRVVWMEGKVYRPAITRRGAEKLRAQLAQEHDLLEYRIRDHWLGRWVDEPPRVPPGVPRGEQLMSERVRIDRSKLLPYQLEDPETLRALAEVEALSPAAWSWVLWALNERYTSLPDDLHSDGPCNDCGSFDNISWYVDSDIWNSAIPPETGSPILCPQCFVVRAYRRAGIRTTWKLIPEESP